MIDFAIKYIIYLPMAFFFIVMLYKGYQKFTERRIDFIYDAIIVIFVFVLVNHLFCNLIGEPLLKKNNLDDLVMTEGYCHGIGGAKLPHKFVLRNNNNSVSQYFYFQLCENTDVIATKYNNKFVKIWYDSNSNYVYQMSTINEIIYTLDHCNSNVDNLNFKNRVFPVIFLSSLIGILIFS